MKQQWYSRKWTQAFFHILCWALLFSLPYLLKPSYESNRPQKNDEAAHTYMYFCHIATWMALFYFNALVLIPRFIHRKKYWQYFFIQLPLIAVVLLLDVLCIKLFWDMEHYRFRNALLFNIFPFLFILACSTAYQMIKDRIKADKVASEKENENLKTELSFLRSQVSPHFMFNVLNNMVALSRKHSEQLEPSLIKLSSLMRYMLYETDEQKVLLERETEYLQSYIDLQQQRFGKKVAVNTYLSDIDKQYEIEPMLLIPFVENAFKHGTGMVENAQIDIELTAKKNLLQFSVKNKFNNITEEPKDKTSGIGLANVKRRLNLLYGNNHHIHITKDNGWFIVSLQINLH